MGRIIFLVLAVIMSLMHLGMVAVVIMQKQGKYPWKLFAGCMAGCSVCTLSYGISVSVGTYFWMSFWSSVYFCSIDIILICLFLYTLRLTDRELKGFFQLTMVAFCGYALFDILVLMINPFIQIALDYKYMESATYVKWSYDPYILFDMHLFFCYILVAMSLLNLILKSAMIPKIYRRRYTLITESLVMIIFLNGLFLFLPLVKILEYDISIFFYSIVGFLIYYNTMYYADHSLMDGISKEILQNMQYPVILFDYDEKYVLHINGDPDIFPDNVDSFTRQDLINLFALGDHIQDKMKNVSFQWTYQSVVYRCDYRSILKKDSIVGYYFTFVNVPYEFDLLTSFHTENATLQHIEEFKFEYPVGIVVCDLNKLTKINELFGKNVGDQAIEALAGMMRRVCPENTYFSRFHDAMLVAICSNTKLTEINSLSQKMMREKMHLSEQNISLQIQCATAVCTVAKNSNIISGVKSALESLRIKKMLDPDSIHSSLLYSLVRILQEADQGTEQHVTRTREIGKKFGEKLQLSDEEISNLELLCLLHDVGKICVPLEILNKPGKLTDDEWRVMKSHAEKGFIIANSSRELRNIADKILHHHEYWNGKGYPGGLKAEEIPLLSRMISIIDAYDAMISDRPYSNNIGTENAIKEMESCAGNQFDPYLVTEFIEMLQENPQFFREEVIRTEERRVVESWADYQEEYAETKRNTTVAPVEYTQYWLEPANLRIIRVDANFEKITGYSVQDVEEMHLKQGDLIYKEDLAQYIEMVSKSRTAGLETYIEHRIRRKDGSETYVYCDGLNYFDSALNKNMIRITVADIFSSVALQRKMEAERTIAKMNRERWLDSLRTDPMCGILNRMTFRNALQAELLQDSHKIVMMMSDLDNFKAYNDRYGHIMGDTLLKDYAKILQEMVGQKDIVCRMGGDEFAAALLFPKEMSDEEIKGKLYELWKEINSSLEFLGDYISSSMGFALSNGKERTFNQLYEASDAALYYAKEKGKNQCCFW